MQVPFRLIFRVYDLQDRYFWKRMAQQGSKVVREVGKGVVSAFEAVDEDKDVAFAWLPPALHLVGKARPEIVVR